MTDFSPAAFSDDASPISCDIAARLEVVIPHETFSAKPLQVSISALSPHGAQLLCSNVSLELARHFCREPHSARIIVERSEAPLKISGNIIWAGSSGPNSTRLGIAFDQKQRNAETLVKALLHLANVASGSRQGLPVSKRPISSSWNAAIQTMGALFSAEHEKLLNAAEARQFEHEKRGFSRIPCDFSAQFRFETGGTDLDRFTFSVRVLDVSWTGVKIRITSTDHYRMLRSMEENNLTPILMPQKARGWVTLRRESELIGALLHVAWFGKTVRTEANEAATDFGGYIDGKEAETKYVRAALVEMARAHHRVSV